MYSAPSRARDSSLVMLSGFPKPPFPLSMRSRAASARGIGGKASSFGGGGSNGVTVEEAGESGAAVTKRFFGEDPGASPGDDALAGDATAGDSGDFETSAPRRFFGDFWITAEQFCARVPVKG
jgi:hypothetical protein